MKTLKLAAFILLASCCSTSRQNKLQYVKNNGGIISYSLKAVHANAMPLMKLIEAVENDSFPNTHSILIMKHDVTFFENYYQGCDQNNGKRLGAINHDTATLHDCRSITKTVVSACIGMAIKKGLISSVDEPVKNYFPEYARFFEGEKSKITIRHLLM